MHGSDVITWFEIPAVDLGRASRFYDAVLPRRLERESMGPHELAVLNFAEPGVGECLTRGEGCAPSTDDNVVYVNAGRDFDEALVRVQRAGRRVALPKTALPEGVGCFAHIIDGEGNRAGLHAMS